MSVMSFSLGLRADAAARTGRDARVSFGPSTLAELGRGASATITGVSDEANPAVARRLFDLGFAPGAEVQMLRRAPMVDPVVFRIAGYDIALRRAEARHIQVAALA